MSKAQNIISDFAILDVMTADGEVFPLADVLTEAGVPIIGLEPLDELCDGFIRAAVVENDDLREVEDAHTASAVLADLALDAQSDRASCGTRDEV